MKENDLPAIVQKMMPHILKRLNRGDTQGTSGGSGGSSVTLPSKWAWNKIDFTTSSLGDIVNRSHALLSNRTADDHTIYLMQTGRDGFIYLDALAEVRDPTGLNRRGTLQMNTNGFEISSYDDTALAHKAIYIDGSDIYLRPSASATLYTRVASTGEITAAPSTNTVHKFGYAYLGYAGYSSNAAFGHQSWTAAGQYMAQQDISGDALFNAPGGHTLYIRNGNLNRLSVANETLMYAGSTSFRTDNFAASQIGPGFKLGYDGSGDFRYLYTDQLHAKVFIADLEQALAGLQIITKSVTILDEMFTAPYPGQVATLHVKDLPSATGMQVFQSGDIVDVRQFSRAGGSLSIADCWGVVTSPVDNGDKTQTWTFTRSGTPTYNTIAHRNTQTQSSTLGAAPTVLKPTGTAVGDILLAVLVYNGTVSSITQPSGFTLLRSEASAPLTMYIWYRIADGTEGANLVWALGTSVNYSAMVTAYSNPYALYPVSGSNSQSNVSTASMAAPTVSAKSAKDMLLFIAATGNVRATPPAGMTERADAGVTSAGVYLADVLLSASGATGTKTATLATASNSAAALIALAPSWSALGTTAGAMYPGDTVNPDAIVLDYGTTGNGYAEVNAIDGLYAVNSPYYQIVTWTTHPATGKVIRMRLGNLNGLSANINGSGLTPTGYGLFTDNAFLSGVFVAGSGHFVIDSDGSHIDTVGDIGWSLSPGFENITVSNYQSYSFGDPGLFGGVAGGQASTYDRVMMYNQQTYVDKAAQIIIDARQITHSSAGVPTYNRDATIALVASRWMTDDATVSKARVDLSGVSQSVTLTASSIYAIGDLILGDPTASTAATWNIKMPPGSGTINSGNGRNMVIQAGSTDNQAGKTGGSLTLRPGIPTSPATAYGDVIIADQGGRVSLFGSGSFGGGIKVISIANAGTNPSSNPAGGGILYADSGAGKWRGSSGTTTTFGPAEPHCKRCGRDYALEWNNDTNSWGHMAICVYCLTKALEKAGIMFDDYSIVN